MPQKRVIIVAGFAGSGKSTLAEELAKKFGLKCVHASGILRELLEKDIGEISGGKGKNTGWWESEEGRKFLGKRLKDGSLDRTLDKRLLEIIEKGDVVVDSWTMPWLSKKGFKIWLNASIEKRAERVSKRDGRSAQEIKKLLEERDAKTAEIYKELYGFEIGQDLTPFNLVIETDNLGKKEVFEKAVEALWKFDGDSFN